MADPEKTGRRYGPDIEVIRKGVIIITEEEMTALGAEDLFTEVVKINQVEDADTRSEDELNLLMLPPDPRPRLN